MQCALIHKLMAPAIITIYLLWKGACIAIVLFKKVGGMQASIP